MLAQAKYLRSRSARTDPLFETDIGEAVALPQCRNDCPLSRRYFGFNPLENFSGLKL
jgi:hypothetical protein